jgi:hypothetical protein
MKPVFIYVRARNGYISVLSPHLTVTINYYSFENFHLEDRSDSERRRKKNGLHSIIQFLGDMWP